MAGTANIPACPTRNRNVSGSPEIAQKESQETMKTAVPVVVRKK